MLCGGYTVNVCEKTQSRDIFYGQVIAGMRRMVALLLAALMAAAVLAACAPTPAPVPLAQAPPQQVLPIAQLSAQQAPMPVTQSAAASAAAFAIPMPVASGVNVSRNNNGEIDFSNASDGYVMARFTRQTAASVRVIIVGPNGAQYQYFLNTNGRWEVFPLSVGNGQYTISIFEQISGNRFAQVNSVTINVTMPDPLAPFLRPNQFVNFNQDSRAVTLAGELTRGSTSTLDRVSRIYNWVIRNISYDFDLARNVRSGFVPNIDQTIERGRGICFCYSSVMTAMLRSQGIPTRLVIGYAGTVYHAWISVWTPESGWINNVIWFDGRTWRLMDPTFAATGNQSPEVMQFIGTGANYRPMFFH